MEEMDSNLRFLVARPSWETGLLSRKRERICWGTEGSNPSPSRRESAANLDRRRQRRPRAMPLGNGALGGILLICRPWASEVEPAEPWDVRKREAGDDREQSRSALVPAGLKRSRVTENSHPFVTVSLPTEALSRRRLTEIGSPPGNSTVRYRRRHRRQPASAAKATSPLTSCSSAGSIGGTEVSSNLR
jgi:hypothetical protein